MIDLCVFAPITADNRRRKVARQRELHNQPLDRDVSEAENARNADEAEKAKENRRKARLQLSFRFRSGRPVKCAKRKQNSLIWVMSQLNEINKNEAAEHKCCNN